MSLTRITTYNQRSVVFQHGSELHPSEFCVRIARPRHGGVRILGFVQYDVGYVFTVRATKQMPAAYWWDPDGGPLIGSRRVRDPEVAKLAIGIFRDRTAGVDPLLDKLMERWPELTPAITKILEGPR